MRFTGSLQTRLLGVAVLGAIGSLVVGGVAYLELTQSTRVTALLATTNSVQRAQMDADMMHDAIRADVYAALLAAGARDTARMTEVRADLTEHSERFNAQLAKLVTSSDNARLKERVKVLSSDLGGYVDAAARVVDSARTNLGAAQKQMPAFGQNFSKLEGEMSDLGDIIEKETQDVSASTEHAFVEAKRFVVIAALLTLVIALGVGAHVARVITRGIVTVVNRVQVLKQGSIETLTSAIESLARGDLSASVTVDATLLPVTTTDEIGVLTATINDIVSMTARTSEAFGVARKQVQRVITETEGLTVAAQQGALKQRGDEQSFEGSYRALIHGINQTLDAVIAPVDATASALERLARRDLRARVDGQYRGDHARIQTAFNTAVDALGETVSAVAATADGVAVGAGEIGDGSKELAQSASAQAALVEEVAASARELAATTRNNASNAAEGRSLSEGARQSTSEGVREVANLAEAIDRIKKSSESTAKIVKTIDEIAFQTNLLALNAAVEAARAGESGKGFAVVADEVRNLAMRAAEAAKQTAQLIDESVVSTDVGVTINERVRVRLADIEQRVRRVGEVVDTIVMASDEQAKGVSLIDDALESMSSRTQSVAASADQSDSASRALVEQSDALRTLVGQFEVQR